MSILCGIPSSDFHYDPDEPLSLRSVAATLTPFLYYAGRYPKAFHHSAKLAGLIFLAQVVVLKQLGSCRSLEESQDKSFNLFVSAGTLIKKVDIKVRVSALAVLHEVVIRSPLESKVDLLFQKALGKRTSWLISILFTAIVMAKVSYEMNRSSPQIDRRTICILTFSESLFLVHSSKKWS